MKNEFEAIFKLSMTLLLPKFKIEFKKFISKGTFIEAKSISNIFMKLQTKVGFIKISKIEKSIFSFASSSQIHDIPNRFQLCRLMIENQRPER